MKGDLYVSGWIDFFFVNLFNILKMGKNIIITERK